jgi:hypothetical protein
MLTIFSKPHKQGGFCDGLNRRDFLTIGGSVAGGLMLPDLLRAEAEERRGTQHKAIINIYLPGGPPHQDMWTSRPKPRNPRRVRSDPHQCAGIEICELFPIARNADKFVFIRRWWIATAMLSVHDRPQRPGSGRLLVMMGSWCPRPGPEQPPYRRTSRSCMRPIARGDPYRRLLGMGRHPVQPSPAEATGRRPTLTLNGVTLDRLNDRVG